METKIPTWFYIVAVVLLIWNAMGVMQFFMEIMMSPEDIAALPDAESLLYENYPMWAQVAFGAAVFGGFLGSIFLLLKSKWARLLFIVSLVGIVIQMYHSIFIAKATDVYGPGAVIMPIMIMVIGITAIVFSNYFVKKGWLK